MSDIARLFSTRPQDHTDDDIRRIIEHFRTQRASFATPAPKSKPAAAKKSSIDLSDLDL